MFIIEDLKENCYQAKRIIIFCRNRNHCHDLYRAFVTILSTKFDSYMQKSYAICHANNL